jgi:hypothetical protein
MIAKLIRKLRSWFFRYRDAVTGRFVSKSEAIARPRETIREKIENEQ